jgi:hypothetical protein
VIWKKQDVGTEYISSGLILAAGSSEHGNDPSDSIKINTSNIENECSSSKVLGYTVPHNSRYTHLLKNISLYFVLQQVFLSLFIYFYLLLSHASFHTFIFERKCSSL